MIHIVDPHLFQIYSCIDLCYGALTSCASVLFSRKLGYAIACLVLEGISVGCETWEEAAVIIAEINSVKMLNPFSKQVVLRTRVSLC